MNMKIFSLGLIVLLAISSIGMVSARDYQVIKMNSHDNSYATSTSCKLADYVLLRKDSTQVSSQMSNSWFMYNIGGRTNANSLDLLSIGRIDGWFEFWIPPNDEIKAISFRFNCEWDGRGDESSGWSQWLPINIYGWVEDGAELCIDHDWRCAKRDKVWGKINGKELFFLH